MADSDHDMEVPLLEHSNKESEIEVPLLEHEDSDRVLEEMANIDGERMDLENQSVLTPKVSTLELHSKEMGVESLDYDPIFSLVQYKTTKAKSRRHVYGYTGVTLAKWTVTILLGILVGLVAYVIESSQEYIVTHKKQFSQKLMSHSTFISFIVFTALSIFLVTISSCLVLFWAPAAAGGGVTLVMAYLNGNDIPDFFRFSTLVTKIIGTICSISSGLMLGQEGPMVHIGAALASTLTWMHGSVPLQKKSRALESRACLQLNALPFDFHNDKDRREFISAGCAAGLAAAFGAPIGGVLYSLEEASSFWSRKVMWRSLICCTCATMILALINEWEYSASLPGSMSFHGLQPEFIIRDLPFFVITSACAGILGAIVNIAHGWIDQLRPPSSRKLARVLEACTITLISIIFMFGLPLVFGKCLQVPQNVPAGSFNEGYWFRYNCPKKETGSGILYYNDLATLFFSLPRQSMQQFYQRGSGSPIEFTTRSLGIHAVSVFVMFVLAYGVATPGGIFMPSMLLGASFGLFVGQILEQIFPGGNVQPGLHALVGSTAMLGGLFRASISLVVIMVEGTGGIDFILPIITAIVVSNWVAHHIHHSGAYEADLERIGGVCFLHSEPPHEIAALTAADIMSSNVLCLNEIAPFREVVELLKTSRHNGFPVLRKSSFNTPDKTGKFVGLILRHQLLLLLEQHAFVEVDSISPYPVRPHQYSLYEKQIPKELQVLEHAMRVYHHYHYPHRRYLSSRPEVVEELGLGEILESSKENDIRQNKKMLALDLRPFMNRAPLTVRRECSAQRVYIIFRTLGLRHLCVTDSHNRVIGIITRKDIAMAQKVASADKFRKSFQHWDSDVRSFNERQRDQVNKLYNLP